MLIGTDRMFGVADEGPQLSVEMISEALLRRGGPDGLSQPTEQERGVTMLVVRGTAGRPRGQCSGSEHLVRL